MKIKILLFVLPVVIGLIASATGFELVWRLFLLSILAPLISYAWSFFNIRGIKSEIRSLPAKSYIGDVLSDNLKVTNSGRLPKLLLKVRENSDLPDYSNLTTFNLSPGGSYQLESKVTCSRRGLYSLGSYTLMASDPFGWFPRKLTLGESQKIYIYPNTLELPYFDPLSTVNLTYGAGRWLESQISPNVASIREYVSGDSLKHIHWQSTAHSGQLMVKLFDPDRSHSSAKTIWVVLDMHRPSQSGSGIQSTEEYGVSIAASLLKKYIENGWPAGLMASGDQPHIFAPDSGSQHLELMNTVLASVRAEGKIPIEDLVSGESSRFGIDTLVIVITPSWSERLVASLLQLKGQQGIVVAILLEPHSFGGSAGSAHTARSLILNGIQVYVVKKGDNFSTALDTRNLSANKVV